MNRPDVSILIVNWNSATYLRSCLTTIESRVHGIDLEVVVVDNASYDGSAELVAAEFPRVRFVQAQDNLGFARANNLAFAHSTGSYILLLNPDTEMVDDAVKMMHEHLRRRPRTGAVGCCVVNSDLTPQRTYAQAFPTISNQVLGADLLHRLFPRSRLWGMRPMVDFKHEAIQAEVLSGACLMVRRELFEGLKGFDPRYYMYGDDVDLCFRIGQAGYRVDYVGSKRVIHHGGTSTAFRVESEFATVMQKESIFRFLADTRGPRYARRYRWAIGVTAMARIAMIGTFSLAAGVWMERTKLRGAWRKWWSVLRWAAGRENWAVRAGH